MINTTTAEDKKSLPKTVLKQFLQMPFSPVSDKFKSPVGLSDSDSGTKILTTNEKGYTFTLSGYRGRSVEQD